MPILTQVLLLMSRSGALSGPQRKFVLHLLLLWLGLRGRFNFTNLSRYSPYHEQTFRRHFARSFPWGTFNAHLLAEALPAQHQILLAQDASFVPKSGRHTAGLGWFYNGCAGRTEKGLELSLVAAVDLNQNTAYALHAKQTIPPAAPAPGVAVCKDLQHLQETKPFWPVGVSHLAVDGAYTRYLFIQGACELGLNVIGKLRKDANLRYLFTGKQKPRGRPKLYDGKVLWKEFDPARWLNEGELEPGVHFYSALLYHVSLKRTIKVVLLLHTAAKASAKTPRQVLLFSTDLQLDAYEIVRFYRARFQIEFLFRDTKSGAGLTHCQGRSAAALDFHWNAAFTALNLAKIQTLPPANSKTPSATSKTRFSWASSHQKHANEHFLRVFSRKLDLDWSSIKSHPNFLSLCNYGAIDP